MDQTAKRRTVTVIAPGGFGPRHDAPWRSTEVQTLAPAAECRSVVSVNRRVGDADAETLRRRTRTVQGPEMDVAY